MAKTKCVHCKDEFDRWDDYARHILDKHLDDKLRADWARSVLAEPPAEVAPKKVRGHLLDRISPMRLLKHPQEQLGGKSGKKSSNNKPN